MNGFSSRTDQQDLFFGRGLVKYEEIRLIFNFVTCMNSYQQSILIWKQYSECEVESGYGATFMSCQTSTFN